ncbi:penicillin acylase family protein [Roseomonas sp. HF4]|uniref:penicillin acylase family protein n=1 Tax=Roseomonas sp. HF4 TaxID=2562313 RepID=UPI0010C08119|nr:penicillin acylase family protein [Roseomonas sp. HF4]
MMRVLIPFLMLLPACAALDPRPVAVDRRIAALPAAGAAVEQPVTIRWNDHMVPWVEAATDRDLFYALGLVHGHLRGAQVALLRLAARGRLSEAAGPFAADIDHALRILDFGRAAPAIRAAWPEETRRLMAAFVAGLNHATMTGAAPPEFALLGLRPEPYTEDDLLAIGRLAGTDVNWLRYFALLPARGTPGFARLWERTVAAGSSAPEAALAGRRLAVIREILAGTSRAGSNTVAVAGRRSASGGALIGSDPHLGLNLPNLWLAAGMRSPSFHAVGLMVPGLPIIGVGRNAEIGWGGTNMRAASSDLFDVSALPPEDFRTETVRIGQRLWFATTRQVRITPHGPVLTDAEVVPRREGDVIALRWVGHEPTDEITALLAAARARNGRDFRAAFDRFGVSAQNMLWAARDGSIGQFYATTIPSRAGAAPEDPVLDARDPAATAPWGRLLRTPDLPFVVNPREGFLASANNRPEPLGGRAPPPMGFFFSDSDRVERLREMLVALPRATPADIMAIQTDTRSPRAGRLAAALLARLDDVAEAAPIAAALRGWDGDYRADSRAPVAFEVLLARLVPRLAEAGRQDATGSRRAPESQWNFITAFLLPDLDALDPAQRTALLRDAASEAAADLAALGTWGDMHRLRVSHWLVNLPVVGGAFAYDGHPVGGSRETPMKTSHGLVTQRHNAAFGSMARHVSDMADPDANWFTLWGGQDGWLGSAAFADQVPLWLERRSIRIPLTPATVAAEFPRVTRLDPP